MRHRSAKPNVRGFTLVEVMVVIVIIGLLASIVTVNVRGHLIRAKQNTARLEISQIAAALETYYSIFDRYPSNEEGLAALTKTSTKLPEPLLTKEPIDPWGNPYQYVRPGRNGPYEVVTLGADGREGGEGSDADLSSEQVREKNNR